MTEGIVHRHESRVCWDCGGIGLIYGAISLKIVERTLVSMGWRFLEPEGRMICSECAWKRRGAKSPST